MSDISQWLEEPNLGRYVEAFDETGVGLGDTVF